MPPAGGGAAPAAHTLQQGGCSPCSSRCSPCSSLLQPHLQLSAAACDRVLLCLSWLCQGLLWAGCCTRTCTSHPSARQARKFPAAAGASCRVVLWACSSRGTPVQAAPVPRVLPCHSQVSSFRSMLPPAGHWGATQPPAPGACASALLTVAHLRAASLAFTPARPCHRRWSTSSRTTTTTKTATDQHRSQAPLGTTDRRRA